MRWTSIGLTLLSTFFIATSSQSYGDTAASSDSSETILVFGKGKLVVPSQFKRVEKQSRILEHEFQAKAGEDDTAGTARITMMAAGGDVSANIRRWQGQFTGGTKEDQKTEELKVGDWVVHIVDLSGDFADRVGGGPFAGGRVVTREDYAMTGAILVHPDGRKYFVKMIGPTAVINANRKAFIEMVKNIQ